MEAYSAGFATLFNSFYTGWVKDFSAELVDHLARTAIPGRPVLDLCCGTGVTMQLLCAAGWQVIGVDRSPGMLDIARQKLAPVIEVGQAQLLEADARDFRLPSRVGACFCLDGALNHMDSVADLERCFAAVEAALLDDGQFVFDLYEPAHFRHWNKMTFTDEPGAVVAKRGVWDEQTQSGMLRVSGAFDDAGRYVRVEQTLISRAFDRDQVASALSAAGLALVDHDFGESHTGCGSGVCAPSERPCRSIYRALK